jgi:uncharacterized protein (TIGR02117 family)
MKPAKRRAFLFSRLFVPNRYFTIMAVSALAFLTIGILTPRQIGIHPKKNCNIQICVSNTGIHSNIILPLKNNIFDWQDYLSINEIGTDTINNYNFLSFGWGDRDFYLSTPTLADFKLDITFKALFLPTPSVVYVKGYQAIPNDLEVKCVRITEFEYFQLTNYIQATFKDDAKGQIIRIADGHTDNAGFYSAVGNYSILRNCNSWTGEALRTANVNTPLWDGLSFAIMLHLRNNCD